MKIAAGLFAIFLLNAFSDEVFAQAIGDVFLSPAGELVQVRGAVRFHTIATGQIDAVVHGSDGQEYNSKAGWKFVPLQTVESTDFIATEKKAERRDQPAIVTIQRILKVVKGANGQVAAYLVAEDSGERGTLMSVKTLRANRGQIVAQEDLPTFIRQVPSTKIVEITSGTAYAELGDLNAGKDKILLQIFDSVQTRRTYSGSRLAKSLVVDLYNRAKQMHTARAEAFERMLENYPAVQKLLKLSTKASSDSIGREAVEAAEGAR